MIILIIDKMFHKYIQNYLAGEYTVFLVIEIYMLHHHTYMYNKYIHTIKQTAQYVSDQLWKWEKKEYIEGCNNHFV